ncbi:ubiquinol-cytochrome c reductase iron-sulfur subunit [Hydrogenophilus thermoluteolus]|uniref:Ubiquinol-cytochrome c reductase iron-sulfur subunit n=1 Tax=Hydrogenophilus thermoluteolus TaxID=297 RepID=A0A2Z6DVU8_HYDTE|nr:ubiquinol-cytochrome c reductase iron-sulfur subunit [Hydrogenophilus thermoluteolus]BBD76570.1 ubiquinol-cytochrome c reductase, iron-sulfur subunit [Hydrogenophilus thermoluteolus]
MTHTAEPMDDNRRQLLVATSVVGGAGAVALAAPFVASFAPSERAKAAGAPVEVDISKVPPGEMIVVEWRGKPIWVLHRTPEMLESLKAVREKLADPDSEKSIQPPYAKNEHRSIKPEFLIVEGVCTHLGCSPSPKFQVGEASGISADWVGGYLCPCHGSMFDLAGRVFKHMPAPTNLPVPPHKYLTETKVLIGEDKA